MEFQLLKKFIMRTGESLLTTVVTEYLIIHIVRAADLT